MRRSLWVLCAATLMRSTAAAQASGIDPQCRASTLSQRPAEDACQKGIDIFRYLAPQLGTSVVGGNAILGESGALGGVGHVSLGIRGNMIFGRLPRADRVSASITGAVVSDIPVVGQILALPAVDAAIGLFPGVATAGARALVLDALVSLAYVPPIRAHDVTISVPHGSVRLGAGGRLTLLDESIITPAITVTYLRRTLPRVEVIASPGADELAVRDGTLETAQWRAIVGKHLGALELTLGAGQDRYETGASVTVRVQQGGQTFTGGPFDVSQAVTRTSAFAGASLDLARVRVGAEVGRVSGGTVATYNTFGRTRADDALLFASIGVRAHR